MKRRRIRAIRARINRWNQKKEEWANKTMFKWLKRWLLWE